MLKKTIEYEDWDGVKRTEDFYFNISKSELMEMELSTEGGLKNRLEKIAKKVDAPKIMEFFKDFILKSYCEKSDDGRRLIKRRELAEAFTETPAYDILFMELISDQDKGAAFISGVLPKMDESPIPAPPEK